jgi:hypothetical protein
MVFASPICEVIEGRALAILTIGDPIGRGCLLATIYLPPMIKDVNAWIRGAG